MNCTRCQTANPDGARFCMSCGTALSSVCPNCGAELPSEAKFCPNCGHQLAASQTEAAQTRLQQYIPKELLSKLEVARASGVMQGERRIVTMLFCDVQGSTAAAQRLDPEEWAEIMNGAFQHLIEPVYRYEGTLARLMGDAILAFFGAPIAHEDDPQRAILAGLDIIRDISPYREEVKSRWGLDFNVRVGINTGLVVVGEVGSDLRVEYTALGDAINLAARMEQTAQPGTVQVSADTHRLVAPLFEFESLGGIEVRGRSEPVQAYRVVQPKADPGRLRGIEGLDAPLIGRDQEIDSLRRLVDEVVQGRGQIASIMGEAGLGKSRLIAELRKRLAASGLLNEGRELDNSPPPSFPSPQISWCEGRSLSYQTSTPYAPFVDLFTRLFKLRPEQTEAEKYDKLGTQMEALIPGRSAEFAPFIATLLGISPQNEDIERIRYLAPPQLRDRVFRATREFFGQLASKHPIVLIFEDLHWIDPTSLDLIEQLLPLADRAALFIIGMFRPWRQDPSWRFHEVAARDYAHRYTSLNLEPLDEDSSHELIASLLAVDGLPEKVQSLIFSRSEGNPFYVEEIIRSLMDTNLIVRENSHWRTTGDIENITVPDTLSGVITARLDRLDEEDKRVVQMASVIGREFQFDTLVSLYERADFLDDTLSNLQRRELIREKSRVPTQVYMFKHALTQETAYASLLLSTRRELHRRLAEYLEQTEVDRVNDISRNYLEAREPARALPYLVESGDRAARAYSAPEAIGYYTQALEILETVKDLGLARRTYEGLGDAHVLANDIPSAVNNYHSMFHSAQEYDDIPMQVSALNKLGFVTALRMGEYPEAEQHLVDAERLAKESNDLSGLAEMHMTYCYLRVPFGDFDGAVDHLSESAEIGRQLDLEEPRLFGLTHIANTLTFMTRFEDAWKAVQEAQGIAESLGNRRWLSEILSLSTAQYHIRNGDLDAAYSAAREGADLAGQIGASEGQFFGPYTMGQIAWLRGDYEHAIVFQQQALQGGNILGIAYMQAAALCALGTAHLDISVNEFGEQTAEFYDQALRLMEEPLGTLMGAALWAEMGFGLLGTGELERAGEFFQRGLTVSTALKNLARPFLLIGSAIVSLLQNDVDGAEKLVEEAREFAEERGMKNVYPFIALAGGHIGAASADTTRALEQFSQGEELALAMQMRPLVWQIRLEAARVLSTSGREKEANAKLSDARAMVDEIAGLFEDDNLRALYLENAVRKLSQVVG